MKLYQQIASTIGARKRCAETGNQHWQEKHEEKLAYIEKRYLPKGSGIDAGCSIDLEKSSSNKLVINSSYHVMDESGFYDGWVDFTIAITPSLIHEYNLRIKGGRKLKYRKEYLLDLFNYSLDQEYREM